MDKQDSSLKLKMQKQSEKMLQLEQVLSFKCTVENFTKFNYCKGLVYIQEFWKDEPNEFKRELMEEFPNIADIEEASFIKSKGNATPLLLYFKTPAPPPHLDIPGEPYITKVYNFKNKPMMCKKCLKYGHTKKNCKETAAKCAKCCGENHKEEDCSANVKCLHCPENHKTGNIACTKQKEEQLIIDTEDSNKVTRQRAKQIITPVPDPPFTAPSFTTQFILQFNINTDQQSTSKSTNRISAFSVARQIKLILGQKLDYFRKFNNGYKLKVSNRKACEKVISINRLSDTPCTITPDLHAQTTKGIIHVSQFHCTDASTFISGLESNERIAKVTEATWIKSRNSSSRAFQIDFYGCNTPSFIPVLGERAHCKVYAHIPTPLRCKQCQDYGHLAKECKKSPVCGKCSDKHNTNTCTSEISKCKHCGEAHYTGSGSCNTHKEEKKIQRIITTRKLTREGAITYINSNTIEQRREEAVSGFWQLSPRRDKEEYKTKPQQNVHNFTVQETEQPSIETTNLIDFAENYNSPIPSQEENIIHFYTQEEPYINHYTNQVTNQQHYGYFSEENLTTQEENNIHNITSENVHIPNEISDIPLPN